MATYDHKKVEKKWQEEWNKNKTYTPDLSKSENKFYNLMMFPYPSAEGLHAGNMFAFTGSDVQGRFQRMQGKNVLEPIGLDGFGIHSENYALKVGKTPKEHARDSEANYYKQLHEIGNSFDWTRVVETYDPDYYKWTQWLFIQMYKAGLAYRKKAQVNFCPSCKTVLADEQVMSPKQAGKEPKDRDGNAVAMSDDLRVCERCGTIVEKKDLDQWFFKITNYADRLLEGLDKVNWSERVRIAQKEWIGRSHGRIIKFKLEKGGEIEVFTTRPDTLNAVSFLATAELYKAGSKEKTGEFSGEYATNPLDNRRIPIWKTNYVAPNYGTGVVMGVPAHDDRDREFATKYHIDIVSKDPEDNKVGKAHTTYHLRDWLISRQRYWGAPIPMVWCDKCLWQTVPEDQLPVLLPDIVDYKPQGQGRGPLASHPEFYETICPNCDQPAKRETDVMDAFVDSSWYFLRYPSANLEKEAFNKEITNNWLPVDLYFGGAEHSVLHLMYARFITMVLHDRGFINFEEPFPKFFAHGLMIKDGAKMSKSKGNVVNPDDYIAKFGADTLRIYLMFMGPIDSYPDFRDSGIEGTNRFVKKLWSIFNTKTSESTPAVIAGRHKTIKKVSDDIANFRYNTALSSIMEYLNLLKSEGVSRDDQIVLVKLIAPFAPHLAEEVWVNVLGQSFSVHTSEWPKYDVDMIRDSQIVIVIQVNGKLRSQIVSTEDLTKKDVEEMAKKDPKVEKWLTGDIRNVIYVPGKLINFVTA